MNYNRYLIGAACTLAALIAPTAAGADVLNFDDLSGSAFFTSNYRGFTFGTNRRSDTAWFYSSQQIRDANGNLVYRPSSGSTYIATDFQLYDNANRFQATQPISRSTAFVFDGAFFSGDSTIGYQLFLNNVLVHTSSPSAELTSTPTFVASGYAGFINSIVISGHQGFYALDDFTFRNTVAAPAGVPEPASWAMMIVGFGVVGAAMRQRKRVHARVSFAA